MNYIAIDIGGTKTLLAVFNQDGEIIEKVKFPTPSDYQEFLKTLKENAAQLENTSFRNGGIGSRGLIDTQNGVLISDNIINWPNAPLTKDFNDIFDCEFTLGNDSKLAGLSEADLVNDTSVHSVVYITVSTGIGSVLVIDKKIDKNTEQSEVGKWIFDINGKVQTWESFASGKAITEKYGLRASDITDEQIWKEVCHNLSLGIVNIAAAYTPDLIIIGGGVGQHFAKFGHILNETVRANTPVSVHACPIIGATRSEEAVIYGAYLLAKNK
jgi:glucokinase